MSTFIQINPDADPGKGEAPVSIISQVIRPANQQILKELTACIKMPMRKLPFGLPCPYNGDSSHPLALHFKMYASEKKMLLVSRVVALNFRCPWSACAAEEEDSAIYMWPTPKGKNETSAPVDPGAASENLLWGPELIYENTKLLLFCTTEKESTNWTPGLLLKVSPPGEPVLWRRLNLPNSYSDGTLCLGSSFSSEPPVHAMAAEVQTALTQGIWNTDLPFSKPLFQAMTRFKSTGAAESEATPCPNIPMLADLFTPESCGAPKALLDKLAKPRAEMEPSELGLRAILACSAPVNSEVTDILSEINDAH